jgi:hypothetical protein
VIWPAIRHCPPSFIGVGRMKNPLYSTASPLAVAAPLFAPSPPENMPAIFERNDVIE